MERSRNGTLISLNSQDFENLESVEELYFGERETEDNQEPENFLLEESSSERGNENDEANSCIEMGEAESTEKEKIEKFIADTCKCKFAEQRAACSTILLRDDFHDSRNKCRPLPWLAWTYYFQRENWPTATRQELLASKSLMKKRCDFCHQSCPISLIRPHLWNNGIMFVQK